ncbi:hypothetical protein SYN63AY4M2_13070 [Synechococcus sp. 63AY4M2]|nr:hypothetical protein SYN63AY4M2_13070 [Synechococcus sp. 63AY4M2]PIK89684.1 hypothetical protein SYN65AY6A5_03360 [Synechococcus sp. 65AY6A5]PIK96324.1 hypothetical protein SYN60AY4M2_00100 [Synechococcus sp. 60AY4M2]PIK99161.1 hypothetical protein SYN63AY4M1_11030 [Synechococcus sp. 63AY4M1]PIL02390.1 hypothetical protein SYN65AY640_02995 [Synechococcus sp. 65AY640]
MAKLSTVFPQVGNTIKSLWRKVFPINFHSFHSPYYY